MNCVTVMLITSPELTLLADEMQDSSAYTNTQDEWESGKMQEEQPVSEIAELIDETRKVEEQDTGESDGIYIGEEDDILDLMDISGCTITLSATSYTYNGSAKKPVVTVKDGAATLTLNTDYTVNYEKNKDAGSAAVKVVGTGNYKGEKSIPFTIKKAAPKLAYISEIVSKTTLDEPFTNSLSGTTDGTVSFESSNKSVAAVDSTSGTVTIKGAGESTITASAAEGKNYKAGSTSYKLEVTAVSIKNSSIGGVSLLLRIFRKSLYANSHREGWTVLCSRKIRIILSSMRTM